MVKGKQSVKAKTKQKYLCPGVAAVGSSWGQSNNMVLGIVPGCFASNLGFLILQEILWATQDP